MHPRIWSGNTETNLIKKEIHSVLSLQQIQTHSPTRFGFKEMQKHTILLLKTLNLSSYIDTLPVLFLSELREDGQHIRPPFLSHSVFWKQREGWAGDKRDRRPPQKQNMIGRCPVSMFHLILAGSPSGKIPQTYCQSLAGRNDGEGWGREMAEGKHITSYTVTHTHAHTHISKRKRWLILWVWESRAPNTGWPGFRNEFDSSHCLLNLTGD